MFVAICVSGGCSCFPPFPSPAPAHPALHSSHSAGQGGFPERPDGRLVHRAGPQESVGSGGNGLPPKIRRVARRMFFFRLCGGCFFRPPIYTFPESRSSSVRDRLMQRTESRLEAPSLLLLLCLLPQFSRLYTHEQNPTKHFLNKDRPRRKERKKGKEELVEEQWKCLSQCP